MNESIIINRLVDNIIDYTIKTREKVYNNVREEMVNYFWNYFCKKTTKTTS